MGNGDPDAAGWYPDPIGRHDYRFWNAATWTEFVSDEGTQAEDQIAAINAAPVTVRPSGSIAWARLRAAPPRRWAVGLGVLAIALIALYEESPWLMLLNGGFGLLCLVLLPVLYFNVFYIDADSSGIVVRNQFGLRQRIPRARIGTISIGKAWVGGFSTADVAFIVSPNGQRLGRYFLRYWNPEDFERVANAVGLHLYGLPGRRLDEFHSANALRQVAREYINYMKIGVAIGCGLPTLFVVAFAVAVLIARVDH